MCFYEGGEIKKERERERGRRKIDRQYDGLLSFLFAIISIKKIRSLPILF